MTYNSSKNNSIDLSSHDPFDEFEFKPLTEGLGFHRKSTDEIKTSLRSTPSFNKTIEADVASKINFKGANLSFERPVVPTKAISIPNIEDDSITKAQSAVNEILKNLNHKKQQEDLLRNKSKIEWKSTTPSFAAGLIDAMFVIALFLICMVSLLSITKVDLIANLSNPGANSEIRVITACLGLFLSFTYMTLFRTYLGYTPGEWAFDQKCGHDLNQASSNYVPKIVLRFIICAITGFIPLMAVSWLLRYDLVGALINLPLQRKLS